MDLHQFPRVKGLSSLWSHRLLETQVSSITFCMSACICLGTDRKYVTYSNCIIYGECNKGTVYKAVNRMSEIAEYTAIRRIL